VLPSYEQDPSYYSDWGDPREYTIEDMGVGECAGEIVPYVQMGLADAEREIFEAQLLMDEGKIGPAALRAYSAMLQAARALAREKNPNLSSDPDEIAGDFRRFFFDTQLFFDPYAGGKFAQYFFRIHEEKGKADSQEAAHMIIEEAQLFVDAAHQCHARLGAQLGAVAAITLPGAAPVAGGTTPAAP
jgi:sulfite reductase (ferredoxin)